VISVEVSYVFMILCSKQEVSTLCDAILYASLQTAFGIQREEVRALHYRFKVNMYVSSMRI
jgi:hypothetical protein